MDPRDLFWPPRTHWTSFSVPKKIAFLVLAFYYLRPSLDTPDFWHSPISLQLWTMHTSTLGFNLLFTNSFNFLCFAKTSDNYINSLLTCQLLYRNWWHHQSLHFSGLSCLSLQKSAYLPALFQSNNPNGKEQGQEKLLQHLSPLPGTAKGKWNYWFLTQSNFL